MVYFILKHMRSLMSADVRHDEPALGTLPIDPLIFYFKEPVFTTTVLILQGTAGIFDRFADQFPPRRRVKAADVFILKWPGTHGRPDQGRLPFPISLRTGHSRAVRENRFIIL